jgi:hypothetical protein
VLYGHLVSPMRGLFRLLYNIIGGRLANGRTPTRFAKKSASVLRAQVNDISGDDNSYPLTEKMKLSRRMIAINIARPRVGGSPMSKKRWTAWRLP